MVDAARPDARIRVTVAWSLQAGLVQESALELGAGATLGHALDAVGLLSACQAGQLQCGVWGRAQSLEALLHDGDRIEAVRALHVDPKEARRMRFNAQGRRSAGLFVRRR